MSKKREEICLEVYQRERGIQMKVMEGEKLISEKLSFKWGRWGKMKVKKFEGKNENE